LINFFEKRKKFFFWSLFFLLLIFSFYINYYYANLGVQAQDTFFHYDSAYFILNGKHPFKDYWNITGIFIDYLQSFFFFLFGINFNSYIYHASFINSVFAVISFFFFLKINLNFLISFLLSISISILFYPGSGTPFVDYHAVGFSVISVFFFYLGLTKVKNLFFILSYLFLFLSFLCKQIPFFFIFFLYFFILSFKFLKLKNNQIIFFFISFIFLFFLFFLFLFLNGIPLEDFINQYIYYPFTIGGQRSVLLNLNKFTGLLGELKFIFLSLLILLFVFFRINYAHNKKDLSNYAEFYLFIFSIFFFILYQSLTKNQVLIFFLIPIIIGVTLSHLKKNKYEKIYLIFFLLLLTFVTLKYHHRYNENKYFLDFKIGSFDKKKTIKAENLDKSFKNLQWITPFYFITNSSEEINQLKLSVEYIKKNLKNKIIISDYLFLSSLVKSNIASPLKFYDSVSVPDLKNPFYNYYKSFFITQLKKNNVAVVYTTSEYYNNILISIFFDKNCIISRKINSILYEHNIKECFFK